MINREYCLDFLSVSSGQVQWRNLKFDKILFESHVKVPKFADIVFDDFQELKKWR